MPVFRSLAHSTALSTALCGALALPLHAQNAAPELPVTIWDTFSLENILTMVVQSFTPTLRVLADVRYDQIDVDPVRNRMALIGVDIRPYLPHVEGDACVVTADTLVISGQPVDRQQGYVVSLALNGAELDIECLPEEARPIVGMMGVENIHLNQATVNAEYDFASGGAMVQFGVDLEKLASLSGAADLDYISYRMDMETEEVMPAVHVNQV